MKAHLLVFDNVEVEKDVFLRGIDEIESIENWNLFLSNTMCVASRKTSRQLAAEIRQHFPNVRFVITTVDPNQKGGWLPKSIWNFLNHPAPAGQEADA